MEITTTNVSAHFAVYTGGAQRLSSALPWNPHPKFKGVALQHLLTGADTAGMFSCHLVRVEPGCALDPHLHATQWELHQVLQGEGSGQVGAQTLHYQPGCLVPIPLGLEHGVQAGEAGLLILAKFCPPLI